MIELGRFVTRKEAFNPTEVFKFIMSMFNLTAQQQKSDLSFQIVDKLVNLNNREELKTSELDLMDQQEHNLDNKVCVKLSHLKAAI